MGAESIDESLYGDEINFVSSTAIPGMIKNAEGKINGKITYVRLTIRKRSGVNEN